MLSIVSSEVMRSQDVILGQTMPGIRAVLRSVIQLQWHCTRVLVNSFTWVESVLCFLKLLRRQEINTFPQVLPLGIPHRSWKTRTTSNVHTALPETVQQTKEGGSRRPVHVDRLGDTYRESLPRNGDVAAATKQLAESCTLYCSANDITCIGTVSMVRCSSQTFKRFSARNGEHSSICLVWIQQDDIEQFEL